MYSYKLFRIKLIITNNCIGIITVPLCIAVGNSLVMKMWGKKADPAMHAIHFGYSLGSVLTPLMVAPYLSPGEEDNPIGCVDMNDTMTSSCVNYSTTEATTIGFQDKSRVEIPYFISGFITIATSLVFWILFAVDPPKGFVQEVSPKRTWKQVFNPGSCARGHVWYGVALVTLLLLWTLAYNGVQSAYTLGFRFVTDPDNNLGFTRQEGAWYDFTRRVAGTVGRLLGIIISPFCPIQVLLMFEVVMICGSSLVVAFVGTGNKMVLWVFTALTSMMTSPAHPGLYAFIDKYIILYSLVVALSMVGSGLVGFLLIWANGYIYDRVDKRGIFYLSAGCGVLLLVVQIALQAVASVYGSRHNEVDPDGVVTEQRDDAIQAYANEGFEKEAPKSVKKREFV